MKKILLTLIATFSIISSASAYTVSDTFDDLGTDYNNTKTVLYSGSENIDVQVFNLFLSFIEQSRPDITLNKGSFAAKILDKESNEEYNVIADVTRVDNESPMYIKIWFKMDLGGQNAIIYTQFKVDEAPSTLYPLGVWSFKYSVYLNDSLYANAIAAVSKSNDQQRLELNMNDLANGYDNNLAFEFDAITQNGVALVNGISFRYNQRYMDFNTTHYEDAQNVASVNIYEYNLFDRDGAKVEFTTGVFFELNHNGAQYYGYESTAGLYINDTVTFSYVDLNSSIFDDIEVEDYYGNSYTITKILGSDIRRLLQNATTPVVYTENIMLISDTNSSLTAKHHGDWMDTRSIIFENGHHFNNAEYYIKQVYGVKNLVKVQKTSVLDEDKPSSSATIIESNLVPVNVKNLIGNIPANAPLLLKYGEEI